MEFEISTGFDAVIIPGLRRSPHFRLTEGDRDLCDAYDFNVLQQAFCSLSYPPSEALSWATC